MTGKSEGCPRPACLVNGFTERSIQQPSARAATGLTSDIEALCVYLVREAESFVTIRGGGYFFRASRSIIQCLVDVNYLD
jgi:hypothetical protein